MLSARRHELILEKLAERDYLTVVEAQELLNASAATVRRDFADLSDQGIIERVRGGVRPLRRSTERMIPFALREKRYSIQKRALAKRAVALLRSGQVVFIDGGTTTFHLGLCLPNLDLRIVTNSLRLANLLEERCIEHPELEIFITGGFLYTKSGILLGPNTETALAQYHAHWAFLSIGGGDASGIYNTNELVMKSEQVMMEHADKVVVLADRSKIGQQAMCQISDWGHIDILITEDWPAHRSLLAAIRQQGVEVIAIPCHEQEDAVEE